jgi:hypothetical protein
MYRLRFQIEFLYRDAKQFTGLNDCQARSPSKLNFHNMSLTDGQFGENSLLDSEKDEKPNRRSCFFDGGY